MAPICRRGRRGSPADQEGGGPRKEASSSVNLPPPAEWNADRIMGSPCDAQSKGDPDGQGERGCVIRFPLPCLTPLPDHGMEAACRCFPG